MTARFRPLLLAASLAAAPAAAPGTAAAHAALVAAETAQAIRLTATYDTGTAMAGAQVVVFAPDDPATVWLRGETDAEGRFHFLPDRERPGRWTVQVRQAGHGAMAHVDTGAEGPADIVAGPPPQSLLQRLVMVGLVVWGALGTALYVRSTRRGGGDASA